jgi:hypothetical protein
VHTGNELHLFKQKSFLFGAFLQVYENKGFIVFKTIDGCHDAQHWCISVSQFGDQHDSLA